MVDRRNDLLALLKQHSQPLSRKAGAEDALKQREQAVAQKVKKEVARSRQPEALKKSSLSKPDIRKHSAVLKQHSEPSPRNAAEEIPPDLHEVWKKQLSDVDELIELGLAEIEAFKVDDVARIRSIVDQQQEAIDRMQMLEQREAEVRDPVPLCLIERAKRLRQINETNRLLARMALNVNKMMQKALGLVPSGSYDDKGMPSALQKGLGRLDASA